MCTMTTDNKLTVDIDTATRSRTIRFVLTGWGPGTIANSYSTRRFRPDRLTVSWRSEDDGKTWEIGSATVSGPVPKKDGTDSLNRGDRKFYRRPPEDDVEVGWINRVIDTFAPENGVQA